LKDKTSKYKRYGPANLQAGGVKGFMDTKTPKRRFQVAGGTGFEPATPSLGGSLSKIQHFGNSCPILARLPAQVFSSFSSSFKGIRFQYRTSIYFKERINLAYFHIWSKIARYVEKGKGTTSPHVSLCLPSHQHNWAQAIAVKGSSVILNSVEGEQRTV
jgi:hypothetical protein